VQAPLAHCSHHWRTASKALTYFLFVRGKLLSITRLYHATISMKSEPWLRYWLNCYLPLMSSFIFYLVTYLHTSRENASTSQTELSAKAL